MESKIIAIRKQDVNRANEAFAHLMKKTEISMNQFSCSNPSYFKGMSASQLEIESCSAIKEACNDTPFDPNNIILVSGHTFPDIVAENYYGVEVKSTKANHWTSTGSSIVESTRSCLVEDIFMLFGKLGGNPPEFRCRPYADVLSDIAVTHSPRYLINMGLQKGETIFDKMETTYDEFRTSEDNIAKVREYYKKKAKKGMEMPWWISKGDIDKPINFNLRLWNSLEPDYRKVLTAYCLILFPEIWMPNSNKKTKYNQASLWLCSFAQVIYPNIRDSFTAGGQITRENGRVLSVHYPQIYKTVIDVLPQIKILLEHPSNQTKELIQEFNPILLNGHSIFKSWVKYVCTSLEPFQVPMERWIKERPVLETEKKNGPKV